MTSIIFADLYIACSVYSWFFLHKRILDITHFCLQSQRVDFIYCFGCVILFYLCFIYLGYFNYIIFFHILIPMSEYLKKLKVHCPFKGCTCIIMLLYYRYVSGIKCS